jgi:cytochrome c2
MTCLSVVRRATSDPDDANVILVSNQHVRKGLRMVLVVIRVSLLVVLLVATTISAQDGDAEAGKALYDQQCSTCHGLVDSPKATHYFWMPRPWSIVQVGVVHTSSAARTEIVAPEAHNVTDAVATRPHATQHRVADERSAFAPPYGPNLRGIYERPAGTVPGFPYSHAFLQTLHGMIWNDSTLDVWLTDTQAWVPGVRMFYAQSDPEIRRQIILYLKAKP